MPSRRVAALSLAFLLLCTPFASNAADDENPFNVGVVPPTPPASLSIQTAAIPAATTAQTPPAATQATPPPPHGVILPQLTALRTKATTAAAALASALASAQSAAGAIFDTLAAARGSIISVASRVTDVIRAATNAARTATASLPFIGEPAPRNENAGLSSPGTHPLAATAASAVPSELNAFPTHPLAATAASAVASGLTLAPTGALSDESPTTHPPSAASASAVPSGLEAFPTVSPTASPTTPAGVARDLPNQPDQPNQPKESTGRVLGAQTAAAPATAYITLDQFSAGLSGLGDIFARAFGNTAVTRVPEEVAAAGNSAVSYFPPASQRIDQLTNTAINAPTITGGAISGASSVGASGGSFDALSAGTLALSGTLAGTDASFSGTLTAGTLNVAGVSSGGAITGPYFTATSTTAASSFAGGLTAANSGFNVLQNGSVGIGTTTPGTTLTVQGSGIDNWGFYKQYGNTVLYSSTTNNTLALGAPGAASWLSASSTPWYSVAIGPGALAAAPTSGAAINNTALGYNALNANTTGGSNTAIGATALAANTTGVQNTAIGSTALTANTTGANNTASGIGALFTNTTGSLNAAYGASALRFNSTGSNNTANGVNALRYNLSATNTVAVGFQAGLGSSNYSNQGDTVVGYQAGYRFTTGSDYNTLLGFQSGYDITSGNNNLILGTEQTAGTGITSGSNNILLGKGVRYGLDGTASNQLNIGNLIFATGLGSENTLSTGNVGIGTTTPWAKLSVQAADNSSAPQFVVASSTATSLFVGSTGNVGIGTTNPNGQLDLEGFTVNGSSPLSQLNVSGTVDTSQTSGTGSVFGSTFAWNTVGSNTAGPAGLRINLNSGYTGSGYNRALVINNNAAGSGLWSPYDEAHGNYGAVINSQSAGAAGDNVGIYAVGDNSQSLNIGIFGRSTVNGGPASIAHVGVMGYASSWATGVGSENASEVGGYFALQNSGSTWQTAYLTNTYAALVAENGQTGKPIFIGRANNVDVFTIDGNGNVGIGTTTPWGKLSVTGSGTGTGLAFAVADSANTPHFVIQDNGNVGIGTASPRGRLDVVYSSVAGAGYNSTFDKWLFEASDNNASFLNIITNPTSVSIRRGPQGMISRCVRRRGATSSLCGFR